MNLLYTVIKWASSHKSPSKQYSTGVEHLGYMTFCSKQKVKGFQESALRKIAGNSKAPNDEIWGSFNVCVLTCHKTVRCFNKNPFISLMKSGVSSLL